MKIAIALAFSLLACIAARAQSPMAWNTIYVTNASTSVPTNLTAGVSATTNIYAEAITILGKPSPRGANTSTCYIGTSSGNDTQPYQLVSGGEIVIKAPPNTKFNLRDLWVDVGTGNDGVTVIYR